MENITPPQPKRASHFAIFSVVILLAVAIGVYILSLSGSFTSFVPFIDKESNIPTLAHREPDSVTASIPESRIETSPAFNEFGGTDSGTKYQYLTTELEAMKKDLEKPNDSETQQLFERAIYYKKLASVALAIEEDPVARKTMLKEVYDGLYEGLGQLPEAAKREGVNPRHIRRFYIHTILYTYRAAKDPTIFFDSRFSEDTWLQALRVKYLTNFDMAASLYIDTLFSPSDTSRDNYMVSMRMLNLAELLHYKEMTTNTELKSRVFADIADLNASFPDTEVTQLSNSKEENTVRPLADYALSLGIIARKGGPITMSAAKGAFASAYGALAANIRSDADNLHLVKAQLDLNYALFLFNQEGSAVNQEVVAALRDFESFATKFQSNSYLQGRYAAYIQSIENLRPETGAHDITLDEVKALASQDERFKKFCVSMGLKL
jgi:hypothetical protein